MLVPTLFRGPLAVFPLAGPYLEWAVSCARVRWLTREREDTCRAVAGLLALPVRVRRAAWRDYKSEAIRRAVARGERWVWIEDDPLEEDREVLARLGVLDRLVAPDTCRGIEPEHVRRIAALLDVEPPEWAARVGEEIDGGKGMDTP